MESAGPKNDNPKNMDGKNDRTGRKAVAGRDIMSCPFPALLLGPSFSDPAFSVAFYLLVDSPYYGG